MIRLLVISSLVQLMLIPKSPIKKDVLITLTGTFKENIDMVNNGEKTTICSLPYVFKVSKQDLPLTLDFKSENYDYLTIDIPIKPVDDIGHIYLIRYEKKATVSQTAYQDNSSEYTPQSVTTLQNSGTSLAKSDIDTNIPTVGIKSDNTFAVIIANENYRREKEVEYALNDGETFCEYCKQTLGIPEKNIRICTDATFLDMKAEVDWLTNISRMYGGDARLMFYYAGHGIPDEGSKDAYLLPVDGMGSNPSTGYKLSDLYAALGESNSKSSVVFLDACFSGAQRNGEMMASARGVAIKAKAAAPKGNMVVLSAATGDETAYPYYEKGHGMFTYFLLKKLQETKGQATLGEIADYVTTQVGRKSIVENSKSQTPTATASESLADDWKTMKLF